jgi:DNA polymerase-1
MLWLPRILRSFYEFINIGVLKKDMTRDLILTGGPWDRDQKVEILEYCESDVDALLLLSAEIIPKIDIDQALFRGRYSAAVAQMEHNGVPVDIEYLERLKANWKAIKSEFVRKLTADYGIYDGTSFRVENFRLWLIKNKIPWPTLESGALNLQDAAFKDMARSYPAVVPIREARTILSRMRLSTLAVGNDNRNRCMLSPFGTRTGRNTPSNSKYIFGPAVWLRSLIKPEKGHGLAYIDWSAQEFGIAAKLSEDTTMIEAYESGDPYLRFGQQIGYIPELGTKQTHAQERDRCKDVVLGTNYGMGPRALATRINQPLIVARKLLQKHREVYHKFWKWSDGTVDFAILLRYLKTTFGWTLRLPPTEYNPRTLRNYLIQANGAEMLRIAVCLAISAGVKVCAPIHDAILIEADLSQLQEHIILTQNAMLKASQIVLSGFNLRTDVKVVEYPNRYIDKRGIETWNTISTLLGSM